MDAQGSRYAESEEVDLQQTVSKFIARWVAQAKLDVDPSLVTLRLVPCGSRKPTAEEEAAAGVLDDPRLFLAAAGVTDGCSLLAYVAGSPGANTSLLAPHVMRLRSHQQGAAVLSTSASLLPRSGVPSCASPRLHALT